MLTDDRKSHAETAFREWVEEHVGHVYATALRRCDGRADLAQEVTQAVFCEFARAAGSLSPDVVIGGWLHRCTVYKSSEFLRSELRRRRYEKKAADHQALHGENPEEGLWRDLAPILDEALERLSSADRDALVLRYYERRDLREIGKRLGVSEDAAQKRVTRALHRLRSELRRNGITSTSGGLCSVLGASASVPVPAGLVSSVLSSPATGGALGAVAKTLTAMTTNTKVTILTVGMCATLAVTTFLQHRANARQEQTIGNLNARLVQAGIDPSVANSRGSASNRPPRPRTAKPGASEGQKVTEFAKALADPDPLKRMSALTSMLHSMKADDAPAIGQLFLEIAAKQDGRDLVNEYQLFLQAWGGLDGPAAVAFAREHGNREEAAIAMSGWAIRDPRAAIAWLGANPSEESQWLASGIAHGWALQDLGGASAWVETLPRSDARTGMIDVLFKRYLETRGVDGAKEWFAGISQDEHNTVYRQRAFDLIARRLAREDPQQAMHWLEENIAKGYARDSSVIDEVIRARAEQDPRAAAEWALSHPDIQGRIALETALNEWVSKNPEEAGSWLGQLRGTDSYDRPASALALKLVESNPVSAMEWIDSIGSEDLRENAADEASRHWLAKDPRAAREYLLARGHTQEQIDRMAERAVVQTITVGIGSYHYFGAK